MNKNKLNLSIDIILHVLILFTFLTIFFFAYISKLEKQNLDSLTNDLVQNKTSKVLDELNDFQKKADALSDKIPLGKKVVNIDWNKLNNVTDNMMAKSKEASPEIKKNNDNLFRESMIIIGVLFFLFIGSIIVFKFILKYDIDLKHIFLMNLIVFSIAGGVEFLFFNFIASKYIPVTPDVTTNEVIDVIKKNL